MHREYVKRNPVIYWPTKQILTGIIKVTTNIHVDIPVETQEYISNNNVMYLSLHKSLWDGVGVPYIISKYGFNMPYIVVGDNLFNRLVKYLVDRCGILVAPRKNQSRETIEKYRRQLDQLLYDGIPIEMFPEGSRSKDGLPKSFKKSAFVAAIKTGTQIIPFDVSYLINEEDEFLKTKEIYSFKARHFWHWVSRDLGDIYITFGKPIPITTTDVDELSDIVRDKLLDLARIQPRNLVAQAMMREGELLSNIIDIRQELLPHKDKFVGMTIDETVESLINKAQLTDKPKGLIDLYGNPISHYLKKSA